LLVKITWPERGARARQSRTNEFSTRPMAQGFDRSVDAGWCPAVLPDRVREGGDLAF
jgi:hypothetical protein